MRVDFLSRLISSLFLLGALFGAQVAFLPAGLAMRDQVGQHRVKHHVHSWEPKPIGVSGKWKLSLDSEFNGKYLDKSLWYPTCPWSDNHTLCWANDGSVSCFDTHNVFVQRGVLVLRAERKRTNCVGRAERFDGAFAATDHWGSRTHFAFRYGFVQARIKMPSSSAGHGLWAGFWGAPASGGFPPELDIAEWESIIPKEMGLYYHWPCRKPVCQAAYQDLLPWDASDGWHTYGVDWQRNSITWYVDGKRAYSTSLHVTRAPLDIRLTFEINGRRNNPVTASTGFPQEMRVDYVRVWRNG